MAEPLRAWLTGGGLTRFGRQWLFQRPLCPHCGPEGPEHRAFAGTGTVCASTLVHRAPDDVFRALTPYRLVLVDLDEGLRLMAHADAGVRVGQRVCGQVRAIAGRALPFFSADDAAPLSAPRSPPA